MSFGQLRASDTPQDLFLGANSGGHFPQGHTPHARQPTYEEELQRSSSFDANSATFDQRMIPNVCGFVLKLLVSNNMAGSIIGRAGQTISDLQHQSLTRIKLSQAGDYFPGTQDRVCLVQGDTGSVKHAVRLLLERFYKLQEQQRAQHLTGSGPAFDFIVRVLVPSTCCGMIIGKSGSNIKYMVDTSGATSVRLSPKAAASEHISSGSERILSITGPSIDACSKCVNIVTDAMVQHLDISRYTNMSTSYSRSNPVKLSAQSGTTIVQKANRPILIPVQHKLPESSFDSSGVSRRIASSPDLAYGVGLEFPDECYGLSSREHIPSVADLHSKNTLTSQAGDPQLPVVQQQHHINQERLILRDGFIDPTAHSGSTSLIRPKPELNDSRDEGGMVHQSTSAPDLAALPHEHPLYIANLPPSSIPHHVHPNLPYSQPSQHHLAPQPKSDFSTTFAPEPPTMTGAGCFTAQVLIPDPMIGSILGRGGRSLNDLQVHSGTRIKISQRGEYMPGTRSRIVTVLGPTAQAVWQAQSLMSQRLALPQTAVPGAVLGAMGPLPASSSILHRPSPQSS